MAVCETNTDSERGTLIVPAGFPSELVASSADCHPARVYLGRLASPQSRRVMASTLNDVARRLSSGAHGLDGLAWAALRYQHTNRLRAMLIEEGRAPATVNRYLAAMRGVLRECWRLGLIAAEAFHRAADLRPVTGERSMRGRALTSGEVRALFDACAADLTPAGARNAALLAALIAGGLRRAEAAALLVRDFEPDTGELRVRSGKGRKDRIVYATHGARDAMSDWLIIRGEEPGPLLLPVNKGGRLIMAPMTAQGVYAALHRLGVKAGVRPFSPHDLRRTFISELLDAGADVATVQRLAGHASVTTTARYDRRGERAKRRVADMLHVPYRAVTRPVARASVNEN